MAELKAGRRDVPRPRTEGLAAEGVAAAGAAAVAEKARPALDRHRPAGAEYNRHYNMVKEPEKPLDQIVQEVGRYAIDAYVFVQECIGLATDHVHGPLSPAAKEVIDWMYRRGITPEDLRVRSETGELPPDIIKKIQQLGGPEKLNRHVSGAQLCHVIRDVARERWGLMARGVLSRWGVQSTEDFGQIVFALVNNGWLQKEPTDSIADFDHVFSFAEAFDQSYEIL
jgi:uncharacterized repeat protein (TIGR04138 family)